MLILPRALLLPAVLATSCAFASQTTLKHVSSVSGLRSGSCGVAIVQAFDATLEKLNGADLTKPENLCKCSPLPYRPKEEALRLGYPEVFAHLTKPIRVKDRITPQGVAAGGLVTDVVVEARPTDTLLFLGRPLQAGGEPHNQVLYTPRLLPGDPFHLRSGNCS